MKPNQEWGFAGAPALAPGGPRWVPEAQPRRGLWTPIPGTTQTDGRGLTWECTAVEQGGRVLRWVCQSDGRIARTDVTPNHPQYPTDEQLATAAPERARLRKAAARPWRIAYITRPATSS